MLRKYRCRYRKQQRCAETRCVADRGYQIQSRPNATNNYILQAACATIEVNAKAATLSGTVYVIAGGRVNRYAGFVEYHTKGVILRRTTTGRALE